MLPTFLQLCLILGAAATAQDPAIHVLPAAPARYAGTLHLATGTWTRGTHQAAIGTSIIYNSSCPSGLYGGLDPGDAVTDEGRIPSPSGPSDDHRYRPGCSTSYH